MSLLEFSVNNAQSSSTHQTPFYLNYGEHPQLPLEHLTQNSNVEQVQSILDRLTNAVDSAKNYLEQLFRQFEPPKSLISTFFYNCFKTVEHLIKHQITLYYNIFLLFRLYSASVVQLCTPSVKTQCIMTKKYNKK